MAKRRLATGTALGLSAALTLGACSSSGNAAPRPAVPAACAEATNQPRITSEAQLDQYMRTVGRCIFSLEQMAPAGDRLATSGYSVTTNLSTEAGVTSITLTDRQSGDNSVGWSILDQSLSKHSPQNGEQVATIPYAITAELTSKNHTTTTGSWLGRLQTNNLRDGAEMLGFNASTNSQEAAYAKDWSELQTAAKTLLDLAETSILRDLASPSATATAAPGLPV